MNLWEPNLSWIDARLAVGGRFPVEHAAHLARKLGVRAVIDLRVEDCDDESLLRRHGLTFLHLPTEDQCAVSQDMLSRGVEFTNRHLDRGEKTLIHCEHGVGRSATLALCVLVSRGMTPLEALLLAKDRRPAISPSHVQYEAWVDWLRAWRAARRLAWEIPTFDRFAAVAYRHLSTDVA